MARTKITKKPSLSRRWPRYTMAARRSAPGTGGMKLKRRLRPGTKALREIRKFQQSSEFVIKRAPFERLVREVSRDVKRDVYWGGNSMDAMQEAAEAYLIFVLERANRIALHAGRTTLLRKDVGLALHILDPSK
jgi:histone H3